MENRRKQSAHFFLERSIFGRKSQLKFPKVREQKKDHSEPIDKERVHSVYV